MEGIARDITERKRAEEVLVEVARARAEFLAEVSHELRTPLPVIRATRKSGWNSTATASTRRSSAR